MRRATARWSRVVRLIAKTQAIPKTAARITISRHPRLTATLLQTVGSKGYDGFILARVGNR